VSLVSHIDNDLGNLILGHSLAPISCFSLLLCGFARGHKSISRKVAKMRSLGLLFAALPLGVRLSLRADYNTTANG
jgi:hypothetical protein